MFIGRTLLALALLAVSGDQYFDSNGVRIRYVVAGAGEPVVLIHGWSADARHGEVPSRPEFVKAVREFLARHDARNAGGVPHSNKVST